MTINENENQEIINTDELLQKKNIKCSADLFQELVDIVRDRLSVKDTCSDDMEVLELIEYEVFSHVGCIGNSYKENGALISRIFNTVRRDLDILSPLAEDKDISEIMVNGSDMVFIERKGQIEKTDFRFDSTEQLEEVIRRIAAKVHREINELNPIVDARLEDGSRVNAVYRNVALNGPILTIRKFPEKAITMEDLIGNESITEEAADFLKELVEAGYNIFVSGGTSSGKTTFLNVLSEYIPKNERVIVIEDSAELQIKHIENIVRMECRNSNVQGRGEINMAQLIKASMRMRPDRIIVGEVRGREVMDMLQAMNTGHDGSMSSGHGNSIRGMLRRLESMYLQGADFPVDAIRSQISEGIDIIIHLGRLADGRRKVLCIAEITGTDGMGVTARELFRFYVDKGLVRTENALLNTEKMELMKGST